MDSGQPFKPWDSRPSLPNRLLWVWAAFYELQTCRPVGTSLVPIPWTAIHEYARAKEVAEADRFERLIRSLDSAYLEHHYRSLERKEKKPGGRRER